MTQDKPFKKRVRTRMKKTGESYAAARARMHTEEPAPAPGPAAPPSRVKKVIEIAFEEARSANVEYVGTEHLLLGLLVEGEGIAAKVLGDIGATLEAVRAELDRLLRESPGLPPTTDSGSAG